MNHSADSRPMPRRSKSHVLVHRRVVMCVVVGMLLLGLGIGCADNSPTAPPTVSVPAVPTGLNAMAGNGMITVAWNATDGATGYNLYWDTAGDVGPADSTVTVAQPSFVHFGLSNGTEYYYRVRATNSAGESVLSAQVSAMPTGAGAYRLLACGDVSSFLVDAAGSLWAWGGNTFGQLGVGSFQRQLQPRRVTGISDVVALSSSERYTIALTGSGRAYAWGANDWGELGDGTRTLRWRPVPVGLDSLMAIAAGRTHSLGVRTDGTLWTWGRAPEAATAFTTPTLVQGVMRATGIVAAGETVSLFKPNNLGSISTGVYAWGDNTHGQLGDGTTETHTTPLVISGSSNIVALSMRMQHVVGVRSNGTIVAWGRNLEGQLGNGTISSATAPILTSLGAAVKSVGTGLFHTVALQTNGVVMAWGLNESGQLGDGTTVNNPIPVRVQGMNDIEMIAVGGHHSLALRQDGSLWAWGFNQDGQLGDGTVTSRNVPVRVVGF